ncbi:MAG: hypothetical protein M1821_009314 [Bathelium mastoideum]|nr:MAG: hypothetical protein M1821_009314 [Bathelium mastoideum]
MGPATNQAGGVNDLAHSDTFNAFFRTFYLDHPYILPRDYTIQLLRKKPLPHLELAIHFIGSHYVSRSSSSRYGDALTNCLAQQTLPRDGFMVQTLLLFFTGLHLANEGQRSERYLDSAISLALELGMNLVNFSQHSSENNPVMEESWRRTWWELYIADGLGASFSQSRPYGLWSVPCNVHLPCEDTSFFSGDIPATHSLAEYDDACFTGSDVCFSSYTYLIEASRCLGKVLLVNRTDWGQTSACPHHALDAADLSLANWRLNLPASKQEPVGYDGDTDEVLFRAHMAISVAEILLHRPRSHLSFEQVQDVKTCASRAECLESNRTLEFHTGKTAQAAKYITELIRLPAPLQKHSPFISCCVVLASIVHLSLWSFMIPDGEDASIKDAIRFDIGILKALGQLWPLSKAALGQVQGVAQEMLTSKRAMNIHSWNPVTGNEILQTMVDDADSVDPFGGTESLLYPLVPEFDSHY